MSPRDPIHASDRYPAEAISYAVWLYLRFPLSLRMVEEMLAARGISVTHKAIRQRGVKFGREIANRIRRRAASAGISHLDVEDMAHSTEMQPVRKSKIGRDVG